MNLAPEVEELLTPVVDRDVRVLTIDIERLPGLVRGIWQPKTRYVSPRQFLEWPSLLCFAARWYGHKQPIFAAAWDGYDQMVAKAHELYDEADVVVTFNGIRFDNKHLKSAWLEEGLKPPRPWKDVDLYKEVQQFGFESKSLDSVTRRLGRPGKQMHYDPDMAYAAAEGDVKAQRTLRRYNIGDIELTEWLYDRLRGWMPNHPHLGEFGDQVRCNQCGGDDLTLDESRRYRAVLIDYALYRCDACGANVRGAWYGRVASTRGAK